MYKNSLIIGLLIASVFSAFSQNNTSSPYSRYGIGELFSRSFGQSRAMGGVSTGLYDAGQINLMNPASLSSFENRSFIFEFGFKSKAAKFMTDNDNYTDNSTNIEYFAMGFPVIHSKWHASIGLTPYSFVGYDLEMTEETATGEATHQYIGSGGLQQFYIGNSFLLFKHLSLGFNTSYLFGDLNYTRKASFPGDTYVYTLYRQENTILHDLCFNFGAAFTDTLFLYKDSTNNRELAKKIKYNIGFTYDNKSQLTGNSSVFTTTSMGTGLSLDTLQNETYEDGYVDIPQAIGIGFSLSFLNGVFKTNNSRLTIAADFKIQNWEDARFFGRNDSLLNSKLIAFGLEYVPDYFPRKNVAYYKRVAYRAGFHTNSGYISIKNTAIKDFGISFGLGLPINKYSKSTMNIAIELGKMGTTENNLLQENYAVFSIGLSLHDKWFQKRKFD